MTSGRCPRCTSLPATRSFPRERVPARTDAVVLVLSQDRSRRRWPPRRPDTAPSAAPAPAPAIERFLDLAEHQGRLAELASQVGRARKAARDWIAGDAILVMINCRAGKYDEVRPLVSKLLDGLAKEEPRRH